MANLWLYWNTGTLRNSRLASLFWIPTGFLGLAIQFRIMHWPYATQIFVLSLLTIVIVYAIHFALKPHKYFGDFLRLFVVVIIATFASLVFIRWVSVTLYAWSVTGILLITTLEFLLSAQRKPKEKVHVVTETENIAKDHPQLFN